MAAMWLNFSELRVLVIDDSSAMRKMLQMIVQSMGVKSVDLAESVHDVLYKIEKLERRYDIILCDYILGEGRDGQHLLEELKARKLLPYSTVFIMVTGEREYEKVVSAVELAPDDYLLKPFSGQRLMDRILDAAEKKQTLGTLHQHIEQAAYDQAVAEADRLLTEAPRYRMDILRAKADALISLDRLDEAEVIYRTIIAEQPIPWARFGLARIEYLRHKLGAAEEILDQLIADAPNYTTACDLLAEVKHDLDKIEHAQTVLEHGVKVSPRNLRRQRQLGAIAMLNNDLETAEASLSAVTTFGEHSVLIKPTDYANLARCVVAQGQPDRARKVMQSGLKRLPENPQMQAASLFVNGIIDGEKSAEEARMSVEAAVALVAQMQQKGETLDRDLALIGVQSCLKAGMVEQAVAMTETLLSERRDASGEVDTTTTASVNRLFEAAGVKDTADALFQKARKAMADLNNEAVGLARNGKLREAMTMFQRAASGKLASNVAILNAIHAILSVMEKEGWDADLARQMDLLFERAQEKDPKNAKLAVHDQQRSELMQKYGVQAR